MHVRIWPASLPPPMASNAKVAPVSTSALVRSFMKVGVVESTICFAPILRRISACSGLRTILTRPMPSLRQILLSICPRLEAAAVCTRALWPSRRMVSVMPSAVSGLTKHEAPSAGVMPAGSGRHSLTFRQRYCAYMAPPIMATVLPISAFAASDDPVLITTPAPSLPTGIDSSSRPAIAFIAASGTFAVITGASLVPEALAVVMSAAPIRSPRSDGLIGDASTRTTTSSGPGSGVGTLARDISSSPLFLISERSCSPVLSFSKPTLNLPLFQFYLFELKQLSRLRCGVIAEAWRPRRWLALEGRLGTLAQPIRIGRRHQIEVGIGAELLCGVHRPVGIIHDLAGERGQVGTPLLQDRFRLVGMHDVPHRHGHDVRFLANSFGIRNLVAVFPGASAVHWRVGKRASGGTVDHIDALRLEQPRQPNALVRPPARIVLARKPHEQRLVRRPDRAHALGDLDRKSHAVEFRTAIFIGSRVGDRRQKLVDQIAVGRVDFEDVETCRLGARGGLAPLDRQIAHLVMRQRASHRRVLGVGHRAGRNQFPAFPVKDLRLVATQRLAAFPRARQPRLAAGMTELDAGNRAVSLDEGCAPRQRRNEPIVPEPGIADRAAAIARHLGGFHDDKPCAALCVFAGVDEMPVGRKTLDRRILMHRRHDNTVLEAHAPDRERSKQHGLCHGVLVSSVTRINSISQAPPCPSSYASAFSAALPAYFAWLPSSCSMRSS